MYGYELEPIDAGTKVTQYYDWTNLRPDFGEAAKDAFPVVPEKALLGTLGILAPDHRRHGGGAPELEQVRGPSIYPLRRRG